jgi:hypothetical protein
MFIDEVFEFEGCCLVNGFLLAVKFVVGVVVWVDAADACVGMAIFWVEIS